MMFRTKVPQRDETPLRRFAEFNEWFEREGRELLGVRELTPVQRWWIARALTARTVIMTGYAGLGKSLALRALALYLASEEGLRVLYLAHPGPASQMRALLDELGKPLKDSIAVATPQGLRGRRAVEAAWKSSALLADDAESVLVPRGWRAVAWAALLRKDLLGPLPESPEEARGRVLEVLKGLERLVPRVRRALDPEARRAAEELRAALAGVGAVATAVQPPCSPLAGMWFGCGSKKVPPSAAGVAEGSTWGGLVRVELVELDGKPDVLEVLEHVAEIMRGMKASAAVYFDPASYSAEELRGAPREAGGRRVLRVGSCRECVPAGRIQEEVPPPGSSRPEDYPILASSASPSASLVRGVDLPGRLPVAVFAGFPSVRVRMEVPESLEGLKEAAERRGARGLRSAVLAAGSPELAEKWLGRLRGRRIGGRLVEELWRDLEPYAGRSREAVLPMAGVFLQAAGRTARPLGVRGGKLLYGRGAAVVLEWRKDVLSILGLQKRKA